jgi:molybdopterin/thiamine biosynthesis adenylyltransferase
MSNKSPKTFTDFKNQFAQQADNSATPETFTANTVDAAGQQVSVTDRQERVEGFDQKTLSQTTVLLVGAGGIGGEIGHGLIRKGIGRLELCDEDTVEAHNLSRQRFYEADIHTNKAAALGRNLVREGTTGTDIVAYSHHFQDAVALDIAFDPDLVVCAPDNDAARLAVADHFTGKTPVVFTGLGREANGGYVFVQDSSGPCFRCFRPDADGGGACPGTPAVIDPAKTVAGLALYAVDSTLMNRHRAWDVFEFYLSGVVPPVARTVEKRGECPLCGGE